MHIAKFLTAGSLLTGLLVFGFIISLRSCLSAYDERFALPPVLYFTKDEKEIVFSLVQYNKTTSYSSEQGIVMKTFTNYYFIQINNGVTGEKILDNKIKERTEKKSVVAKIIGAGNNQAWLYVDGLVAYDAFTLQKTADTKLIEDKNPLVKGKLPTESQYYHFSNGDKNIRFTATDGSLWLLNTGSLLVTPDELHDANPVTIAQKVLISKLENLNVQRVSFNTMAVNQDTINGLWVGLCAKEEISMLNESISLNTIYAQDARRQLYTSIVVKKDGSSFINKRAMENIAATEYFLDAGFLLNRETGSIIHIADAGAHLVIYKNKVGEEARIMLCCISNNGKVIWRLNTYLKAWTDWIYKGKRLFIVGNNNEKNSTGCNVLLMVDLLTGNVNNYDYFAGEASKDRTSH